NPRPNGITFCSESADRFAAREARQARPSLEPAVTPTLAVNGVKSNEWLPTSFAAYVEPESTCAVGAKRVKSATSFGLKPDAREWKWGVPEVSYTFPATSASPNR